MRTVTSSFKDDIRTYGRQLNYQISINGKSVEIDDFYSIKPQFHTDLFKTVMQELELESKNSITKNSKININAGVKLNEKNYQYITYPTYYVYDNERQEDTLSYIAVCYDKMIESMIDYDLNINEEITVRQYLIAICQRLNWNTSHIPQSFINSNKPINPYLHQNIGYTFRDVLDEIATITCSFILFKNDEFYLIYPQETNEIIDESYLNEDSIKIGEKYFINALVFSRVEDSDSIYRRDEQSIQLNGLHEYKISNNQILSTNDRDEYIDEMFNYLKTFEFYTFDIVANGILFMEACDRFTFNLNNTKYSTILLNDEPDFGDGLREIIYSDAPKETETEYKYADKTDRRINQTYILVDKQNQIIESVVSNVSDQNTKISQITQTVDELDSKIQDIADITVAGESSYATFTLDNINQSEPIMIRVRPITDNISYLYFSDTTFFDDKLFFKQRKIRFKNNTTGDVIDYEIPANLLYYNNEIYDEFYMNYDSQTCQVIKRCKYNSDGTVGVLETEQVTNYPYPKIELQDGDYTLSLLGYKYGYLFIRLMAKNIYTSQFYTKSEVDSHINQKADEINLGVSQTLTNYSTTAQMNSAISLKANEITSNVSETYSTKTETQNAKDEAIDSANATTTDKLKDYSTTTQMNSAINQKANEITSSVSTTYSTKTETTTAKNEAINTSKTYADGVGSTAETNAKDYADDVSSTAESNAKGYTDSQLKSYSTTTQMNSAITQKANEINSNVSATYETKTDSSSKLDSAKEYADDVSANAKSEAISSANSNTDTKLKSYSTTTQMTNAITQKITDNNTAYVDIEVAKKVDYTDYTKAQIVAKINDNTSAVQINADNISLVGKTIDMSAENIKIESNCLNIDNSGKIELTDEGNLDANLIITSDEGDTYQRQTVVNSYGLISHVGPSSIAGSNNIMSISSMFGYPEIEFSDSRTSDYYFSTMHSKQVYLSKGNNSVGVYSTTTITADGITTPTVTQTSKEEYKKNFEKFENGIDVIKNIDIYKYNLKSQEDDDKKHIGFVIGDKYKYAEEVTSENNDGADIYSFVSVCCRAIQEQQEMIEQLKQEIKDLKERNDK